MLCVFPPSHIINLSMASKDSVDEALYSRQVSVCVMTSVSAWLWYRCDIHSFRSLFFPQLYVHGIEAQHKLSSSNVCIWGLKGGIGVEVGELWTSSVFAHITRTHRVSRPGVGQAPQAALDGSVTASPGEWACSGRLSCRTGVGRG